MVLENAWPPYVILPNEGNVKPASSLLHVMSGSNPRLWESFFNVSMKLKTVLTTVSVSSKKPFFSVLRLSNEIE